MSHPSLYGKLNPSGDYATYTASSATDYLTLGGNVWAAGLGLMNGIGPVSYTHLDVYKRQARCRRKCVTIWFYITVALN